MFGFNYKDNLRKELEQEQKACDKARSRLDEINEWYNSEDYTRYRHLKTLIAKTYETVGIKVDTYGEINGEIDEEFTRADYIEDFAVFFDPKVFDKLKDWCKEYESLNKFNAKVMYGEEQ